MCVSVYEVLPVIDSSYLVTASICAEPENTPVPDSIADPDTKWPPFATTALPVVEESNVIVTTLVLVVTVEAGKISSSLLLNTDTKTFLVPKL